MTDHVAERLAEPHAPATAPMSAPPHGSRLRDRLREQTQSAILDAAESVVTAEGLHARIDAIAARAGVAVGTLYNHFGDREAIVQAVLIRNRDTLHTALNAVVATPSPRFADDLHRFVRELVEHWLLHGAFLAVVLQERVRDPAFSCKRNELIAPLRAHAGALVARGVREGLLRPGHDERFADFLLGLVRTEMVQAAMEGRHAADPAAIADFFLHGASSPA